jgi:hypothetical protein
LPSNVILYCKSKSLGASGHAPPRPARLDEPLEYLAPRLRRVVTGTLAKTAGPDGLRQIVVTMYEHRRARQLIEAIPPCRALAGGWCLWTLALRRSHGKHPGMVWN